MSKTVCICVTGKVLVSVEDDVDIETAIEQANDEVSDMDFGELEDIEWNTVNVEDEDGNRIYES